ncbi:uncharacterized protein MYCFIDRAFT_178619 [Pseudocercospora fijiensis CIRAD86]|uniref:Uncharacterized protein n=1 Tax=Pseudocercospora fijiensis (strain CIRAD86) TaxID=383855 RepID=M3AMW4_PSEFD|nr:uncharacterized protein MYCFIDRAFT_178619 [Pseudocercospora fijiensis CIRAD86]EME78473.1 hypothetical protein MYCFIDRAFT_178619 [Pseudocercospora fijiensis CIRAD86]
MSSVFNIHTYWRCLVDDVKTERSCHFASLKKRWVRKMEVSMFPMPGAPSQPSVRLVVLHLLVHVKNQSADECMAVLPSSAPNVICGIFVEQASSLLPSKSSELNAKSGNFAERHA